MMATAAAVDVVLANGQPAWHPALTGVLPADWVDPARWGIATADQHFSSAVAAALGDTHFAWAIRAGGLH